MPRPAPRAMARTRASRPRWRNWWASIVVNSSPASITSAFACRDGRAACGDLQNAARWSLRASSSVSSRSASMPRSGAAAPGKGSERGEHAGGLRARLGDLARRVRVPHERRAHGHAHPSGVVEVRRADEDRRVEVDPSRSRREPREHPRVVPARRGLVARDDRARVAHRRAGHGRREHGAAQDLAGVERRAPLEEVLGVRQPRHPLEERAPDASAVGAHGAHHLQLLVDDHHELLALLDVVEEGEERVVVTAGIAVPEGSADRVHRDDAVDRRHVSFGGRAGRGEPGRAERERPVRARLVLEQRAQPAEHGRRRSGIRRPRELAADHEIGALAPADLVVDHTPHDRGVVLVAHIDVEVVDDHRMPRQEPHRVVDRDRLPLVHDQATDRGAVVVRREPALAHLAERHECEHLGVAQRDVGEAVDVDDLADEHVEHGFMLAVDHGERRCLGRGEERGKQAGHVGLRSGPRPEHPAAIAKRPPSGGRRTSKRAESA